MRSIGLAASRTYLDCLSDIAVLRRLTTTCRWNVAALLSVEHGELPALAQSEIPALLFQQAGGLTRKKQMIEYSQEDADRVFRHIYATLAAAIDFLVEKPLYLLLSQNPRGLTHGSPEALTFVR